MTNQGQNKSGDKAVGKASFHMEITSGALGVSLLVNGVVGVCELDSEFVSLITSRGGLSLIGRGLSVSSLAERTLEVSGKITEIKFASGKRDKNDKT